MCVTWLVHMCDMTHLHTWHDSFMCVTCLVHMCDMTYPYVWRNSSTRVDELQHVSLTCLLYMSLLHVSFVECMSLLTNICVIYTCWWVTTHMYIYVYIYVYTWIHMYICWWFTFMCVTWLINTCVMTHSCTWLTSDWHRQYLDVQIYQFPW